LRRFWWLPLIMIYVVNVVQGFVYRGSVTFIPTHIEEQITGSILGVDGAELAGALATVALLGAAAGWYVGGILAERLPHYPLVIGAWLATIPLLLLISVSSGAPLILVTFIFVVMNFAMAPALVSLIADFSPPGRMGVSFGMMFFLAFGLGSFAATLAGFTADRWGVDAVFLALAAVSGGGALISGGLFYVAQASRRRWAAASP
jgi:MFS family permease